MMRIFYIDWQQHWKYDRTMNIGANAHGKRAVSTENSHTWQTSVDSWASSDIGQVLSLFYKSLDCFTMRPFHSATIFCCYICTLYMYLFETSPGWLPCWRGFFFNSIWWGALSSNVFSICAAYWSLGRRGYFGVSNGVLVYIQLTLRANMFCIFIFSKLGWTRWSVLKLPAGFSWVNALVKGPSSAIKFRAQHTSMLRCRVYSYLVGQFSRACSPPIKSCYVTFFMCWIFTSVCRFECEHKSLQIYRSNVSLCISC